MRGELSESPPIDNVPHVRVGGVCLEVVSDGDDRLGAVRLVVGHKLIELVFQELVFGLEAGNEAEDFFEDLPQAEAPIHLGGLAESCESVVFLQFVKHIFVHVVDHPIPLAGLDCLPDVLILTHGVCEAVKEHSVDLHAPASRRSLHEA